MPQLPFYPKSEYDHIVNHVNDGFAHLPLISDMCRLNTLSEIKKAGSGHIGTSFSAMDIVVHLYYKVLNVVEVGTDSPDRDIYFSSKGHDAPGLYAVLHSVGILSMEQLQKLRRLGGLDGHPDVGLNGVEANTGSLGMGIAKGRGMAYAKRLNGNGGRVYVLLGDGELQEGQIYESLLTTVNQDFRGMTVIVDRNHFQSDRCTEVISPLGGLRKKFEAFDWFVQEIDGHNHDEISKALSNAETSDRPSIIIAETIKGKGVSFMEPCQDLYQSNTDIYRYHSGAPSDADYEKGRDEILDRIARRCSEVGLQLPQAEIVEISAQKPKPVTENVAAAYGEHLVEMGKKHPNLFVMVADLSDDCRTRPFEEAYPSRFIENGIAEQDMVSMAGGLAQHGILPVVNSFSCFLSSRPNEQIYNAATEKTRIIYALHLAGLLPAAPGKSHQSVRDISLFGALPNIEIMQPCNELESRLLLEYCIEKSTANCAIRFLIGPSPRKIELPPNYIPESGKGIVLRPGDHAVIIAYGPVMVDQALSAAEALELEGVSVKVINMPWLNKVDVSWFSSELGDNVPVLILDDHSPYGGLGDCFVSAFAKAGVVLPGKLDRRGVEGIPVCGQADEVLKAHNLHAENLVVSIRHLSS
jgi:transketolase